jgi:hypothetical protein
MKLKVVSMCILFCISLSGLSQHLKVQSKDSLNGAPEWETYLLFIIKLNGVFDISGGLQGNETFNLNNIDVWDDNNELNLEMDLYQSQIRWFNSKQIGKHKAIGYFEGDFWGGNNHFRLRMAYVNYKFFQIGQDWSFFGDKEIWPNVLDWDGPPSGIWRRNPGLIFYYQNKNDWKFDLGFEYTQAQISYIEDLDSTYQENSNSPFPETIVAVKKKADFGHIRLSSVLRFLPYDKNNSEDFLTAYGFSLSGFVKTNKEKINPIQFQFVVGKGIASYIVSFDGANYDAAPDGYGNLKSIPSIGGWISYEHWLSKKVHTNVVVGITDFLASGIREYYVPGGDFSVKDGSIDLDFYYGLVNVLVDPFEGFTCGIEYNIGNKSNNYNGFINDGTEKSTIEKSRLAQRISFGIFYKF